MARQCVCCGSSVPDNQGSNTCSMCGGDIEHGDYDYYKQWAAEQRWREEERWQEEQEEEEKERRHYE